MLLHFEFNVLLFLLVFVFDLGQPLRVGILLLGLLALRSVRHADVTIRFDVILEILSLCLHFFFLRIDSLPQLVAIVRCSDFIFLQHIDKRSSQQCNGREYVSE